MTGGKLEAAHEEVLPGRPLFGRWLFRLASTLLIVVAALQLANVLGVRFDRLRQLATDALRFRPLGRGAGRQPGSRIRRSRSRKAVRASGASVHRRDGDFSDPVRTIHRVHRLESQCGIGPSLQRARQSSNALGRRLLLERAQQHGFLCGDRDRPVCNRFRPCVAPERGYSRPEILPGCISAALHAEPRGGQLDGRQIDHGEPISDLWRLSHDRSAGRTRPFSATPGWPRPASSPWTAGSGSHSW